MKHSSWYLWLGTLIVGVGVFSMTAHAQTGGKRSGGMQGRKGGMAMQNGFTQQVGGMHGMCCKVQGGGNQNMYTQQAGFPNPFQRQGGQNPFIQQGGMQNPFMQQGAMQNPFMQQVGMVNPFGQQGGGFQNPLMQNNAMQNPLAFNPAQMQMLAQFFQNGNNGLQAQQPQNAAVQPDADAVQAAMQLLQNQGFELKAPVQRKRPQRAADE